MGFRAVGGTNVAVVRVWRTSNMAHAYEAYAKLHIQIQHVALLVLYACTEIDIHEMAATAILNIEMLPWLVFLLLLTLLLQPLLLPAAVSSVFLSGVMKVLHSSIQQLAVVPQPSENVNLTNGLCAIVVVCLLWIVMAILIIIIEIMIRIVTIIIIIIVIAINISLSHRSRPGLASRAHATGTAYETHEKTSKHAAANSTEPQSANLTTLLATRSLSLNTPCSRGPSAWTYGH